MLPEDRAIASSAPDALAMMVKTGLKRGEVDPFTKLFRAQMLDGVYEEDDIAKASNLKDVNGRSVGKEEIVDATTQVNAMQIGKGKNKMKIGWGKKKLCSKSAAVWSPAVAAPCLAAPCLHCTLAHEWGAAAANRLHLDIMNLVFIS
ncbi:unnamed protein product [Closterium sp. NIES-65]|nr:unnamed protein product [Closterium sp. NIES-65]CAI5998913.1 unnamed protein product [Closterium sp. NIES-65]